MVIQCREELLARALNILEEIAFPRLDGFGYGSAQRWPDGDPGSSWLSDPGCLDSSEVGVGVFHTLYLETVTPYVTPPLVANAFIYAPGFVQPHL